MSSKRPQGERTGKGPAAEENPKKPPSDPFGPGETVDATSEAQSDVTLVNTSGDPVLDHLDTTDEEQEDSSTYCEDGIQALTEDYEVLFEQQGFAGLEAVAEDEQVSEDMLQGLAERDLVCTEGGSIQLTDRGEGYLGNWSGFKDYLSSHERVEEGLDGSNRSRGAAADFLNDRCDEEVDRRFVLENEDNEGLGDAFPDDYDADAEFYAVTSALYEKGLDHEGVDPEEVEAEEIAENIPGETPESIVEADLEKAAGKIRADYCSRAC